MDVNNLSLVGLWFLNLFVWCQFQYLRILECDIRTNSSLLNEREVYLPIVWDLVSRFEGI